ncbi:aminoglycoside adenylyltransferase family protein [Nocardia lijiangensis]|uniref:aminoglycoside adenylyltransferase family protein n=1 Tax=Nocardia lijiangensis TaxID=299618 RepID=UPI0008299F0A|nr:aminoglycoside adenylyltransferase family protein [Nocardia lijiangensis]
MTQEAVVADLLRAVLGPQLLGAYRHGSAALGGLRPHSDLDILVVTDGNLNSAQRRALVDGLLAASGDPRVPGAQRPVELSTVAHTDVRPWRYPPTRDFQYGEWLRDDYERGALPTSVPDPDLAVLITMTLQADSPLLGPPPAELLDPVPPEHLRGALLDGITDLLTELDSDTRNVLLRLARVWMTLETGEIRAKSEAASWAIDRLPAEHRPALAHASAVYLGDAEDAWADRLPQAHDTAAALVGEILQHSA